VQVFLIEAALTKLATQQIGLAIIAKDKVPVDVIIQEPHSK
jgi:hypothetical protein